MKKKILLFSALAFLLAPISISLSNKGTNKVNAEAQVATRWTARSSDVAVTDIPSTENVSFVDKKDDSSAYWDYNPIGIVYNDLLDVRDNIYTLTISNANLTGQGSIYVALTGDATNPWTSDNWSAAAILINIGYWGRFNWEGEDFGSFEVNAPTTSVVGYSFDNTSTVQGHYSEGSLTIEFNVKPNGTVVTLKALNGGNIQRQVYNCPLLTTRAFFDERSNRGALLSIGFRGSRTTASNYELGITNVKRFANFKNEYNGYIETSNAKGGISIKGTEDSGWSGGSIFSGIIYNEHLDCTNNNSIDVHIDNLSDSDSNGSFYVILNNSLEYVASGDLNPTAQYLGVAFSYWGSGWKYVKISPLNAYDPSDPGLPAQPLDANFDEDGFDLSFVVKSDSTEIYLDGELKWTLNKGLSQVFCWSANSALLSIGAYEQRLAALNYAFTIKDGNENRYEVEHFVRTYMHEEINSSNPGTGECASGGYYALAKNAFNSLSTEAKTLFVNNYDYDMYLARLSAWANANGDTFVENNIVTPSNLLSSYSNNNELIIVVTASIFTVLSLVTFFIIKKRELAK